MTTGATASAVLAAPPSRTPAADVRVGSFAFVGVDVVPMDTERVLPDQTVVVEGDRIVDVGPRGAVTVPVGAKVVEGGRGFLLPGLVDAHVHLDRLTEPRPDFGDGPIYLAHGVTTVFNLRGEPANLEWKRRVEAGEILAPNLYNSGEFVNEPRVRTPDEVDREVMQQARDGYDLVKYHQVVDDEGRYTTTVGLSREAYLRMNEAARRAGIPLLGHAPVEHGLGTLLEARQTLAHVGELGPLHFLPVRGTERSLFLLVGGLVVLVALVGGWRVPAAVRRLTRLSLATALLLVLLGILLLPGGPAAGSLGGLTLFTALVATLVVVAPALLVSAFRPRLLVGVSWWARAQALAAAVAAGAVALSAAAHWTPVPWRSTDARIARVAAECARAGLSVQATLVVYDTGWKLSGPDRAKVVGQPTLRLMSPSVRRAWTTPVRRCPRGLPRSSTTPRSRGS